MKTILKLSAAFMLSLALASPALCLLDWEDNSFAEHRLSYYLANNYKIISTTQSGEGSSLAVGIIIQCGDDVKLCQVEQSFGYSMSNICYDLSSPKKE